MALDEPTVNDEIFHEGGMTFVVEKALLAIAQPIRVDAAEPDPNVEIIGFSDPEPDMEFTISSAILENDSAIAQNIAACRPSCRI
jgi:hypothetical protein